MRSRSNISSLASAAVFLPTAAFAHTGGDTSGFMHGFSHPMSGLDHVLAMVMVGMFAYQLGGRALWMVPAAFLCVMALGGIAGFAGLPLPYVEIGIALSVVVLGALVATNVQSPVIAAVAIVGFFAVFHGYAHGAEMPENTTAISYAAAFMLATAMLHLSGAVLGYSLDKADQRTASVVVRTAGAAGLVAGLGLVTGLL